MKNEDLLMLYTSGQDYSTFLETNSGFYKEQILTFKNMVRFPMDFINEIRSLNEEKYFLAVAEPWCENCVINITLLQVAAEINEKIKYKIIAQADLGDHLPLVCDEAHRNIPIIFELTSSGEVVGTFCEKPSVLHSIEESSSVVRTAMKKKYKNGGLAVETVREILKI